MEAATLNLFELVITVMLAIWTLSWAVRGFRNKRTVVIGMRTSWLTRQNYSTAFEGTAAFIVSCIYLLFSIGFFWAAFGLFTKLLQ